jgi:dipeptidyl aminopeptidase/acylaminoacyl peptidase
MGQERRIDWIGRDGTPHTGYLLLPGGYLEGERYPLVAYVYPMTPVQFAGYFGYMGGATGEHYYNMQLLATRGYAVLLAGAPLQRGEPMKAIADWALPGIDKVIESGVADAGRVGVFGASAGGYSVLSLIVQSGIFKAAVEHVGPGNLLTWYGTGMNPQGYSHGEFNAENGFGMAGHPWEAREQYIRNSPWFFLDKVTAPLLILHGADDDAVFISQPNEIFVGLRRLGKEAQYALYEGEGHGFNSLANQIDVTNRYIEWFDRYLKPAR